MQESLRLLGVLDERLGRVEYLAGEYSVADVATYPWVSSSLARLAERASERVAACGHVQRWLAAIGERPAVKKGLSVPAPR